MKEHSNTPPPESRPARPGPEETLFDEALAMPPDARAAYLDRVCGEDERLRRRVGLLLQAHERAGAFLEPPLPDPGASQAPPAPVQVTEKPGDTIGRYKIRETLGEGGCGVVYVAEQTEPVRRRVALKVIKLGMDTRSVIARFEAERQALAMMDHPNIARVLDAGTTEAGRPYFVMELVRGIKITDYCDQHQLDMRQRLGLFVQVCRAVQHAHQKGVIHRDIKPSNILVTLHDGVPVPKVIDFGIAKATEGRLTDLTVYTELHQFIGTPAYMSPEQAEMSGLDIDTRSDIYSLGVLLYELLTGETPFNARELVQSGLDRMRRTIREQEPLRPSTRLSTLQGADLATFARHHGAEAPRLVHLIRGDLDWIVMKALEKDRTRRFETAAALAADVLRFLSNEAVEARPPSNIYRFQKLVRRNKTTVAAIGAVTATLVVGLGFSVYAFIQERHALQRAVAAEKEQAALRQQAEAGLALEREMRQWAEVGRKFSTAGLLMSQEKFTEAEELMSQVPPIPAGATIFNVLGLVHARRGEWQAAITNYSRSITADPTNYLAHHCLAPLLVHAGDLDGYRQHRARILSRFGGASDPAIAVGLARDCLIVAPLPADLETIGKMAATGMGAGLGGPAAGDTELAQRLVEYRRGHFAGAADGLQEVAVREQDPRRAVEAYLVLAMAQQQLNKTDEARASLAEGLRIAQARLPGLEGPDWNEQLTVRLLMREARALIERDSRVDGQPQ